MAALPRYAGSAAPPRKTPLGRVTLSRHETARSAVVLLFLLVVTAFVALSLQSKSVHSVLPRPHQMPEARNRLQRRSLAHRFPSSRAFSF